MGIAYESCYKKEPESSIQTLLNAKSEYWIPAPFIITVNCLTSSAAA